MNLSNITFLPKQTYKNRNWFVINCEGQTLGRLATMVATLLRGKTKPYFHPSMDVGDYIILINADSIILNNKAKHYFVYNPGKPGSSLKSLSASNCLPKLIIEKAVKGMLSKTETKRLMRRLNVYNGSEHPHLAQKPTQLSISSLAFILQPN